MNRIILIDGNAILHRAYHALPPLTATDGTIANAIYGFTSVLIKLYHDFHPTHMAVAFDRPEPTFRKQMLTTYQATRPEMESNLVEQIEKVQGLIHAFGIPIYDKAGFEADDILGTLSKLSKDKKIDEVIIVTGDRDLLQLVDDTKGIKVYMPVKGLSEGKLYGEKEVVERMGVAPTQIADFKALAGDQSDNYGGVAGIGPKTAVGLLKQFGTIEELYKHLESTQSSISGMSAGTRDKLRQGKESATLAKTIATIQTDVPIDADIQKSHMTSLETQNAVDALEAFGFASLVKRLRNNMADTPKKMNAHPKKITEEKTDEQLTLV